MLFIYLFPSCSLRCVFVWYLCRPIFPRWWTGTNSYSRTSEVPSQGTTQKSPLTLFWTIFLPPNRYGCWCWANSSPWKCVFKPVLIAHLFSSLFLKMDLLQEFYETTLEALKDAKNDRLWFKTNTKVYRDFDFFYFSHFFYLCSDLFLFSAPVVRETLLGEGRIWKTAEDP